MFWRHFTLFRFNVRVAVSVVVAGTGNAGPAPAATATATSSVAAATATCSTLQHGNNSKRAHSSSFCGGISLILIINYLYLLLLLLLSLHCNFAQCNSNAAAAATASVVAAPPQIDQLLPNATFAHAEVQHGADDDDMAANVTRNCVMRCTEENSLFSDEFGIRCAPNDVAEMCYVPRCVKGCQTWWRALQEYESCQEACSSAQFSTFNLPCISACELAQRHYWHQQRNAMAALVRSNRPQLLAESLTSYTLTLQWHIRKPDNFLASRPFNIQYRYVTDSGDYVGVASDDEEEEEEAVDESMELETNDWFNLAFYSCDDNFNCDILDGLMPYTSYRFRFELPFGENIDDILYSPPTRVFRTSPEGAPISSPSIVNALALDETHFAIFWQPGQFTNGPLLGYKLLLSYANNSEAIQTILPPKQEQYIFADLLPSTNYTLQICMLNADGAGPFTVTSIVTEDMPHLTKVDDASNMDELILVGEYSLRLKSLEPQAETKLIYQSEELISDYAVHLDAQRLFVVDVEGRLFGAHLGNPAERESLILNKTVASFRLAKIALDWLNLKLYIAGETTEKTWLIARCDLQGNQLEVLTSTSLESVHQLEVDPLNGWLFWLQTNGDLQRMDLSGNTPNLVNTESAKWANFIVDLQRRLLIVYEKNSHELYELSFDGSFKNKLRHPTLGLQGELQSFSFGITWHIFATNGTHLMRQNYRTNDTSIWPITALEWCWSLLPRQSQQQPLPLPRYAPSEIQALLSSNMTRTSWKPPALLPLQSTSAWQHWEYELELMDVASNNAFNIRNIKSSHFDVERLQANNRYKLRVRAASKRGHGPWSEDLLTRTWPLGMHRLLWTTTQGIFETDEFGKHAQLLSAQLEPDVRQFLQLNGSIYYVMKNSSILQCAHIMNPELNCNFQTASTMSVASLGYDWRGGKIYWADTMRDVVMRANIDGSDQEFLPIFGAREIAIDTYAGLLYYSTGVRLVRTALSGSSDETPDSEYFHANGISGVIRGFTLDLLHQQLYWVVRQTESHVRLFKASTERSGDQPLDDMLLSHDIVAGSLRYVPEIESLLWLQAVPTQRLVLARTDNLAQQTLMYTPEFARIYGVQLQSTYTPYMDASVVPEAVDAASICIDDAGYWDDFNVKWTAIGAAENYSVVYKVLLHYSDDATKQTLFYARDAKQPMLRVTELKQPQLLLSISLTAHTHWRRSATVSADLRTPAAAPTQPRHLRVFVRRTEQPLQLTVNISAIVRWDPPENISVSSSAITYKVFCWQGDELFAEQLYNNSGGVERALEVSVHDLVVGESYTFQVQAFATGRSNGGEKTAFHTVYMNPDVQALPMLLLATSDAIFELDLDLNRRRTLVHTASEVEHLALMQGEQRLLWVNENVELLTFVQGTAPLKLARMRAEVLSLTVDWIARIVYWAERETDVSAVSIYKLELCQFDGRIMLGTKLHTTANGRQIRDLMALPFAQSLLWLEYDKGGPNATLNGRNLTDGTTLRLKAITSLRRMFEGALTAESETVNLLDYRGKLCAYDVQRQLCNTLKLHQDVEVVVALERDNGYIYALHNGTVSAYQRRKQHLSYQLPVGADVRRIKAYNYQQYPRRECLLPTLYDAYRHNNSLLQPEVMQLGQSHFLLKLPQHLTEESCWLPVPGVVYQLIVSDGDSYQRNMTLFERFVNITGLRAFTNYTLQLQLGAYYQQQLGMPQLSVRELVVRTAQGTPSAPRNLTAYALSPSEIEINWEPPAELNSAVVWYELYWQLQNASLGSHQMLHDTQLTLSNLEPAQSYMIWLKVFSSPTQFNVTPAITIDTFEQPFNLELLARGAYNLTLLWIPGDDVSSTFLLCRALNSVEENEFSIDITNTSAHILITDLEPKTRYEFQLVLHYVDVERPYHWPELFHAARFVYETLGDCPGRPGRPLIEHITGEIFKVFWEPARNNGEPLLEYSLEALQSRISMQRRMRRSSNFDGTSTVEKRYANKSIALLSQLPWAEEPQPLEDTWMVYCNTSELSCIVRELHTMRLLMFRVRARNVAYGWGPYSEDSERVSEPFVSAEKRDSLVFAIIAPAAIVSTFVLLLILFKTLQSRRLRAKKLLEKSRPSIWSNFSTLQQQQLMASRNRTFSVHSHSTLYTGGPLSDADIALLPHINWNQIKLLNFLGSGAFGEVFEGLVKHEDEETPEKVAIKSLRKGASEFSELLQEAQLMSNFKHENIVRLIGVCFDAESISIIMEHMEAGDLLSYLRESRPSSTLQLLDLLTMCIDVATGCSYLEDMHFVHRDLACRNCLVSSRERSKRIVKIGDFGLARDIYKNDYYRKEGEGLLPVRWMSPESLVDGVFTTQSDVWAFAVLCWEILTLGQQPYAARNNLDVLNYVKAGGRLEQPETCPDKLFALMLQCWKTDAEGRPTFRKCLSILLEVKTDVRRVSMGYTQDDDVYATYANNQCNVFSTFLTNPTPNMDVEEDEVAEEQLGIHAAAVHVKHDLKVRFDSGSHKEVERESEINDDASKLITTNDRESEVDNIYINEGISRL